jgi:hypothetical protein
VGYSCTTTKLFPAASYDLTTLNATKVELSIMGVLDDAWMAQSITQMSKTIQRHCKQSFVPELYQDAFDIDQDAYPGQTPGGFTQLALQRWPVLAVVYAMQTLSSTSTRALVAGTDFRLDPETGRLMRLNPFSGVGVLWEALPLTVIYSAGYGSILTEGHAVPGTGPFTVQVAASFSCDQSVSYPSGTALGRVASNPAIGQYSVAAGLYTFNVADAGQTLSFAYASAAVPEDISEICLRLVTQRYKARDRDPTLIQRETPGIGTERFWFGSAPGQKGPFPPDIAASLDEYRMPTVL